MKIKNNVIFIIFTMVLALNAENLLTPPASVFLDSAPGVKCIQDKKQNIQKILVEKYSQDKEGNLCIGAKLFYGTTPGDKYPGRGIAADPETTYKISFEYQGSVPRFWVGTNELTTTSFWTGVNLLKSICIIPKNGEWKKTSFTVKTGKKCKRLSFYVNLYINEKHNVFDLKPGQELSIRNISIEKK